MIISGGENIYPKEVEEILFSHPTILEAAVTGVKHHDFGEVTKGLVFLRERAKANEKEIIQFCKDHLASYKRPKSGMFLDVLPKTASGKITTAGIRENTLKVKSNHDHRLSHPHISRQNRRGGAGKFREDSGTSSKGPEC